MREIQGIARWASPAKGVKIANNKENRTKMLDSLSHSYDRPVENGGIGKGLTILAVVAAIVGFGGYSYLNSDDYKYGQLLADAEEAAGQGQVLRALELYAPLYKDSETYAQRAGHGIRTLVNMRNMETLSTADLAASLDLVASFEVPPLKVTPVEVYRLSIDRIEQSNFETNTASDNIDIHTLLHAASALDPQGEDLSALDRTLVHIINAADPQNIDAAGELAALYFEEGNLEKAKQFLVPNRDQLGASEAAGILGQIYISEGSNAEAYPLMSAYTSARLQTFRDAETDFLEMQSRMWDKQFETLNNGNGPSSFYQTYDGLALDEQQLYVDEYIIGKLESSARYQTALERYSDAAAIVPVVMEFGILQLRTAEMAGDETARKAELKAAEETFLSIQNVAGETDEYKLYLGQVFFWLGKQTEGQALFDDLLEANGRSGIILLEVASVLRSLGKWVSPLSWPRKLMNKHRTMRHAIMRQACCKSCRPPQTTVSCGLSAQIRTRHKYRPLFAKPKDTAPYRTMTSKVRQPITGRRSVFPKRWRIARQVSTIQPYYIFLCTGLPESKMLIAKALSLWPKRWSWSLRILCY